MGWIILGIVFLVLTYWSLKDTVLEDYNSLLKTEEYHVPVWVLLILSLLYVVPIFGIISFIVYIVVFIVYASMEPEKYEYTTVLRLSNKNMLHRILRTIGRVLNKPI